MSENVTKSSLLTVLDRELNFWLIVKFARIISAFFLCSKFKDVRQIVIVTLRLAKDCDGNDILIKL